MGRLEQRRRLEDERYEDAMWMLENGETMERAARRLGISESGLKKLLTDRRRRAEGDTPAPT